MIGKYKLITMCGSRRFKEDFASEQRKLVLEGYIVFAPEFFDWGLEIEDVKDMLDEMHLSKIFLSDGIYVVNKGGYIGESTAKEIAYAYSLGKDIKYMEQI